MPKATLAVPNWINVELNWSTPKNPSPSLHKHDWHELLLIRQGQYSAALGSRSLRLGVDEGALLPGWLASSSRQPGKLPDPILRVDVERWRLDRLADGAGKSA